MKPGAVAGAFMIGQYEATETFGQNGHGPKRGSTLDRK